MTVAKLANQAEVDQSSYIDNIARLTTQLQIERNLASSTAQKYEQLKVPTTSFQQNFLYSIFPVLFLIR